MYTMPGHYYSPLPDTKEIERHADVVWPNRVARPGGVALHLDRQRDVRQQLDILQRDGLYSGADSRAVRYRPNNGMFGPGSARELSAMIRALAPARIVEVGSGFSSAVMLDTNEHFFEGGIDLTFIEPYPQRLRSILRAADEARVRIIESRLQDVDPSVFESLGPGDILFIDSSHVVKIQSDVHRIVFDILPSVPAGVFVHFHDIYYPFEYPRHWVLEGRAWNEAYVIRAFLQYNASFSIHYWGSCLFEETRSQDADEVERFRHGSSLWIRRDQ
jgi:hypothetical protein